MVNNKIKYSQLVKCAFHHQSILHTRLLHLVNIYPDAYSS